MKKAQKESNHLFYHEFNLYYQVQIYIPTYSEIYFNLVHLFINLDSYIGNVHIFFFFFLEVLSIKFYQKGFL